MERVWDAIQQLKSMGVKDEYANYLLPKRGQRPFLRNLPICLNLRHKHAMRLCYNAQEEIWRALLGRGATDRSGESNDRSLSFYLLALYENWRNATPSAPKGHDSAAKKYGRTNWKK